MSDTADGPRAVLLTVTLVDADGRSRQVPVIPPDESAEDQIPVWEPILQTVVWRTASELGFTPTPMVLDVPVVDAAGFELTEGDGALIVCNVPSSEF